MDEKPIRTLECSIEEVYGDTVEFDIYIRKGSRYERDTYQVDLLTLFAAGVEIGSKETGYNNFYIDVFLNEKGEEFARYRPKIFVPDPAIKPPERYLTPDELDALRDDWMKKPNEPGQTEGTQP